MSKIKALYYDGKTNNVYAIAKTAFGYEFGWLCNGSKFWFSEYNTDSLRRGWKTNDNAMNLIHAEMQKAAKRLPQNRFAYHSVKDALKAVESPVGHPMRMCYMASVARRHAIQAWRIWDAPHGCSYDVDHDCLKPKNVPPQIKKLFAELNVKFKVAVKKPYGIREMLDDIVNGKGDARSIGRRARDLLDD